MIEITLTNTNYIVSATSVENDITVSSDNILFTVTDVTSSFEITTEQNNIVFYTDGVGGFDFAGKFLGPWVSGTEYQRNDVVSYNYSIYICQIPFLNVFTSTVAPPQDTTNWELFYFHESTMSYAVITNTATIGRLNVTGTSTLSGPVTINSNTDINGELYVRDYTLFDSQVQVADVLDVSSDLTVGGQGNFSNKITSTTGTSSFYDATVQRQFKIGNLRYPQDAGVDGQVLKTNGSNQASWVNLGDLVFWNLSDDLQTNAFNIHTGFEAGVPNPQLTIGSGNRAAGYKTSIKLEEVPQNTSVGNISVKATNFTINNGLATSFLSVAGSAQFEGYGAFGSSISATGADLSGGDVGIAGKLLISSNRFTQYDADLAITGYIKGGENQGQKRPISINPGFIFPDGTILTSTNFTSTGTGTLVLPKATTSTLGGVIVGDYLLVDGNGRISVDTSTIVTSLSTATTSSLGVIKIGQYLDAAVDGTVSVNTASLSGLVYTLPAATTSTLGGVIIGDYLDITEGGILSVNTTSLGSSLLPIASTSTLGGIRVGQGLEINSSTGALSTLPQGRVSLTEDLITNGYSIRYGEITFTPINSSIQVNTDSVKLIRESSMIAVFDTTATIAVSNQINLASPITRLGGDPTQSRLHVSRIFNWAGVGPPFFPAGIQYGDQSVQLTAYYPNDFGPIIATSSSGLEQQARAVDFNNLSLAVDYNLV